MFWINHKQGRAGFHVKFKNGWGLSVAFGVGTYSDHYSAEWNAKPDASNTAEIAAFTPEGEMMKWPDGDTVQGYQTPAQVLEAMNMIAAK